MRKGLYMVVSQGYSNIYVMADSFDDARTKWLEKYINVDEDGKPCSVPDQFYPMPDTIAFLAEKDEVIL